MEGGNRLNNPYNIPLRGYFYAVNMLYAMKKILLIFLTLLILTCPFSITLAVENPDENVRVEENKEVQNDGIFSTLYSEKYGGLNKEGSQYLLDIVPLDKEQMEAEENKSWWQRGWSFVNGSTLKNEVMGQIYELINMANNFFFQLNIGLTQFMLSTLNMAYEFDLIDQLIEKVETLMQDITGVSGTVFESSGLFGSFAGIIAILAVAYACYLYIWKRAATESIGELMKTVLTFAIALLFFSNYSAFLSGINQVTTEASQLVLSGSVNNIPSEQITDNVDDQEIDLRDKMTNNIWTLFIDRPYLFMQYGTDNVDEIGEERIQELLKQVPGQARQDYVTDKEVRGEGNIMMTYGSVMERAVFTPLYLFVNGLSSIPIFLLALLLLVFQFWFMGIAAIAPFALLFAAIPGQFSVLKKYFVELGLPLILKVVVSFGAIVVFAISEVIYTLNNVAVQGASEYIIICVLQFILLMLMFFLRNRIKNIFSAGSKEFQALRAEVGSLKEAVAKPVKTGVQGTVTVAGAVVGGVMTGGAGIAAGANIGNNVGRLATGEGDIRSVTSGIGQVQHLTRLKAKVAESDASDNETTRYTTDPDQPINDPPLEDTQTMQHKEIETSVEQGNTHEPVQEEMAHTGWSAVSENEQSPVSESSISEKVEGWGENQGNSQTEDYANLTSMKNHAPPNAASNQSEGISTTYPGTREGRFPENEELPILETPVVEERERLNENHGNHQSDVYANLASLEDHLPSKTDSNQGEDHSAAYFGVQEDNSPISENELPVHNIEQASFGKTGDPPSINSLEVDKIKGNHFRLEEPAEEIHSDDDSFKDDRLKDEPLHELNEDEKKGD